MFIDPYLSFRSDDIILNLPKMQLRKKKRTEEHIIPTEAT